MTDQRFAELLARWLADDLDPAAAAELLAAVRADPGRQAGLLREHRLHLLIHGELGGAEVGSCVERIQAVLRQDSASGTQRTVGAIAQRLGLQPTGRHLAPGRRIRGGRASRRLAARHAQRGWWLAAAALLAVVSGVWWQARDDGRMARIAALAGGVTAERGVRPLGLAVGAWVEVGDRLSTGSDGSVRLDFADGTRVELAAGAHLRLDRSPAHGGIRLGLDIGRLDAEVSHQPPGRPLMVLTPAAIAEVVGTRLRVRADEVGTRLEVGQGRVRFTDRIAGGMVEVAAGGSAEARFRPPPPPVAIAATRRPPLFQADFPGSTAVGRGGSVAVSVGTVSDGFLHTALPAGAPPQILATFTPIGAAQAWNALVGRVTIAGTDYLTLDGGFDLFVRPLAPTPLEDMRWFRPLDLDLRFGEDPLTIYLCGIGDRRLAAQFRTRSAAGLGSAPGEFTSGDSAALPGGLWAIASPIFAHGVVSHVGLTCSTDPASGRITVKMFGRAGAGALDTASTTVGQGDLLGIQHFYASATAIGPDPLPGAAWSLWTVPSAVAANVVDYGPIRLFSPAPDQFPASGADP